METLDRFNKGIVINTINIYGKEAMKIVGISLGEELYSGLVSRTVLKTSLLWRHKRLSLTLSFSLMNLKNSSLSIKTLRLRYPRTNSPLK